LRTTRSGTFSPAMRAAFTKASRASPAELAWIVQARPHPVLTKGHITLYGCHLMMRAAVYCRISDDRTGQGLGVARQRTDCEALVNREGWERAEVYVDNDLSAFNGKPRPSYDRMLSDMAAGYVDAVVAWHPDRLYRDMRDMEDFIDAVEKAGAQVRTVTAGAVDLGTASGRMTARVGAAVARHESEHKAERIRRKMAELAEAGKSTGGPRTFGYDTDHYSVRDEEATLVHEAAERALAGESLWAIARDWNERGIPTVRGAPNWSYQSIHRMLGSPRLAGLKTHHGEIVGPALWPAIIDRETHERLKVRLRPKGRPAIRVRKRLLTGMIFCGRCGTRLYTKVTSRRRGSDRVRTPLYSCVNDPGRGQGTACGRLAVVANPVDKEVGSQVTASLAGPGLARAMRAVNSDDSVKAELSARLVEDQERLDELAEEYADGNLTRGEWKAARNRLVSRLEEAERRLGRIEPSSVLTELANSTEKLRTRWDAEDVVWRRAVVEAVVDRVEVAPKGRRGGNRFDPERITVVWRA
jgi:site-specific DNA recombinase